MLLLASILSSFLFLPVAAFTAPSLPPVDVSDLAWEAVDPIPTAPCEFEDGPGPCLWDAQSVGNQRGHSFWIDCAQTFHYFDPETDELMGGPGDAYPNTCEEG